MTLLKQREYSQFRYRTAQGLVVAFVVAAVLGHAAGAVAQSPANNISGREAVSRIHEPFVGDLPEMEERRLLRVLISYSRTNYFVDFAAAHGFEYEMMRKYEDQLNQGRSLSRKIIVVFIPVPLEQLLDDLVAGRGDIAAGGLTVTKDRQKRVAFSRPYIPNVHEVVVSGPGIPPPTSLEDLAGRRVWVRSGSSYQEHLIDLSARFEASGKQSIEVAAAPTYLATEDLLEMVNAGVFNLTVTDEHIADAWAAVLPKIKVHKDLAVHTGGSIAWAVRRDNPKLEANLNSFVGSIKKGTLLGNIFFKRYFSGSKWISNPLSEADQQRLDELSSLFQKYGTMYGFDWLALAAVGFQESKLNQNKRSRAGAIGIMQLRPSTAADKNVGIASIDTIENNIHAGTKYLAFLRDRYFSDPEIPERARLDFALAAYNAGPARIASLRREAEQKGYDPNLWFSNVETIAAARIGSETVKYVSNINMYYVAYTDFYRDNLQRQLQMRSLASRPRD